MASAPFKLKVNFLQEFKDYTLITFGLLCYSIGFTCFQLPYQIATGGVAGAGAVIFYGTGFPVQWTFLLVNIVLLIAAVKTLGWKFCMKTIYAVFMLTFLLGFVKEVMMWYAEQHPGIYHQLGANYPPQIVQDNAFMSCILGAAIEGIGLGIVFLSNGSMISVPPLSTSTRT